MPGPIPRPLRALRWHAALCLCASLLAPLAHAATGKLLLTGGVSSIDGAGGGGLSPWALIGSQATEGEAGVTAFATRVELRDYRLNAYGLAWAWNERIELSYARQDFDTRATGTALGLPGLRLKQDIVAAKLRLAGDAILDADTWQPQWALGIEHKSLDAGGLAPTLRALGADRSGTEVYLSATKLLLASSVLVNGTLRATRANQNGLLGHGGQGQRHYRLQPELSLAWLLSRRVAVGAEFRAKPDNLNPSPLGAGLREDDAWDLFVAWAPSKHASLTAAYVDLGRIVPAVQPQRQTGAYLSLQLAY
jgi:hypothetical protein